MCGIAGFYNPRGLASGAAQSDLDRMSSSLLHRGPDDFGTWIDGAAGIALGHRRLSILDLSPAGHQPMVSGSGRYVIVFNGEIYNHADMRKEIEEFGSRPQWRGHSDTEILLSAFDVWGIEPSLNKTVGMFAFALWDREARALTLARDRLGEKPLYYGWAGGVLLFGSELKALRANSSFRASIDRGVLVDYFRRGYITGPASIYEGVLKLPPGSLVQFSARDGAGSLPAPRVYWSLHDAATRGLAQPFVGSDTEAVGLLESELRRAVAKQCIADVPLGAFLSGGVDSSTIVALMQAESSRPVKTFTIGFQEDAYNEAGHAKSVARQIGTDHTELIVTPSETMEVIPRLASIYDEPFGDSSAIPTFIVSQLARRHVTVALSGDGGDELFCGYARYQRTHDIWTSLRRVPRVIRNAASFGVGAFSGSLRNASTRARTARAAQYLAATNAGAMYQAQMTQRHDSGEFVLRADGTFHRKSASAPDFLRDDMYAHMMYHDTSDYLPDDILVKVDRASMAVGLETRVPMLDHRVVELSWRIPLHLKLRDRTGKWLLRRVLAKYLPDMPPERPKMGFGVPVGEWVRGPLREWAESLLGEDRLRREGFLNPRHAREQWALHLSGDSSGSDRIWHMLSFQAWLAGVS